MQRAATLLLVLALTAAAARSAAAARPVSRAGVARRLTAFSTVTTTWNVEWDLNFVPYPRIKAACGDLLTFRWTGAKNQTVSIVDAPSSVVALAKCRDAKPLTEPATVGEHTEELLTAGTLFFAEPSNCNKGQILVVTVACPEEVAAMGVPAASAPAPAPAGDVSVASTEGSPASAPAPAPAAGVSAASVEDAPAPAPAADDSAKSAEVAPVPAPVPWPAKA